MKTNFLKSILCIAITSAIFTGCVNSDDYSVPSLECVDKAPAATKTVAEIYTQATTVATAYTADDVIEGRIVSSDKGGNFYKIIYMTSLDGSRGFSVAVNQSDLFTDYGVGRQVAIKLQGLYTQIRNNTLQIGALYQGNVGQIATADYKKAIIRACDVADEESLVNKISLSQISNDYIGKLIELENVQFVDAAIGQNYYNPANVVGSETNHKITDATGATLIFRTGSFAEYSSLPVSSKSGKIRGVLTKFNADFQFVARYTTDIKLTENRLGEGPVEPGEPEEPGNPGEPIGTLLFAGGDFENWAAFTGGINAEFGLKAYAVQSPGNGIGGSNAMAFNGSPLTTGNDYVFTAKAPTGLPANPTKITFWVKGTSAKSLSLNVNRSTTGFEAYNLGTLGATAVTINKNPELNPSSGSGANQYVGAINTNNQWVKVTLDISTMSIMKTPGSDMFSLKVGSNSAYALYLDNFEIE